MTEQGLVADIRERLVRVETKIDALNDLSKKIDDAVTKATETEQRSKSNTHRIDKLEANNTWLWRTVVGAIIVAGVGALAIFK
jgi:Protein of unknown function (DUF1267).